MIDDQQLRLSVAAQTSQILSGSGADPARWASLFFVIYLSIVTQPKGAETKSPPTTATDNIVPLRADHGDGNAPQA